MNKKKYSWLKRSSTITVATILHQNTQVISNVEWDKPKNRKEIDEWHDKYLEEHIKQLHEKSKPI